MSGVIVPFDDINASDSPGDSRLASNIYNRQAEVRIFRRIIMWVQYIDPEDGIPTHQWVEDFIELEEFIKNDSGEILSINNVY